MVNNAGINKKKALKLFSGFLRENFVTLIVPEGKEK
jgi:hypothetical protein